MLIFKIMSKSQKCSFKSLVDSKLVNFRVHQSIDCTKCCHNSFINSIRDIHLTEVIFNMENSRRLQTQASLDIMADQVNNPRFKSWVLLTLLTVMPNV